MDIHAILVSQYLASLDMLRQAIVALPESEWDSPQDTNRSWQVAYHAIYFVHEYLWGYSPAEFTYWEKHRPGYEDFDPARPVEPYDKETVLEYLAFCRELVRERVPRMDLAAMEGGRDPLFTMLELQIYTIRHVMQHAGELMERLAARSGAEVRWVGRGGS